MMNMKLFCVLALILVAVNCSPDCWISCPAGQYCHPNEERPYCATCNRGFYCPGDNVFHKCEEGSASGEGAVACTVCPKHRTSLNQTYCILENAPDSIQAVNLRNGVEAQLSSSSSIAYFTSPITLSTFFPTQVNLVLFRFKDASITQETITAYGSTSTGAPSESNHEQAASQASTGAIAFIGKDGATTYFPWYFSIQAKSTVEVAIDYTNNRRVPIKFGENEFIIDREHQVDYFTDIFFELPSVKKGTKLNITSITYNDDCSQVLLYSERNPTNPYPSSFTRDVVAHDSTSSKYVRLNYVTKPRTVDGTAYIVVEPFCVPYSTTPKLKLIVEQV